MDYLDAKKIADLLRLVPAGTDGYTVQDQHSGVGDPIENFHQWANGRKCLGSFLVKSSARGSLRILVIDWKSVENYYLVLFPASRSGPIAESHHSIREGSELSLHWSYGPAKRDGRNEARRRYFVESFQSVDVVISVPRDVSECGDFLDDLFLLAASRRKADELAEERPPVRDVFPEGRLKEKLHLERERNTELIRKAKELALRLKGTLKCICCNFDFSEKYGEWGLGYIEAHHTVPVSQLSAGDGETRLADIAMVCANCHRMLHRRRPWLELSDLGQLIETKDR